MTLHYSIKFRTTPMRHHGETSFPFDVSDLTGIANYYKYTEQMVSTCKIAMVRSFKRWGFEPADMIGAEFYFYKPINDSPNLNEEVIFFRWEKEEESRERRERQQDDNNKPIYKQKIKELK